MQSSSSGRDGRLDGLSQKRNAPRQPLFREYHVEATAFLHEIVRTAECLHQAKAFDGEPALFFGGRWRLLRAIERCGGAPTFSDCARSLRISRQAARELAIKAARGGAVELLRRPTIGELSKWH